ncbi:MAG: hypothetical protein ACRDRL_00270 [Sciscionella sp.]
MAIIIGLGGITPRLVQVASVPSSIGSAGGTWTWLDSAAVGTSWANLSSLALTPGTYIICVVGIWMGGTFDTLSFVLTDSAGGGASPWPGSGNTQPGDNVFVMYLVTVTADTTVYVNAKATSKTGVTAGAFLALMQIA